MPIIQVGAPKFSSEPLEGKTTNNITYIPHDVKPRFKHEKGDYEKPQGEVEKTSSYNYDYVPHRSNPANTAKPLETYVANKVPFEDGTTHNHTYLPWQVKKVDSMKPDSFLKTTDAKMNTKSTHQLDFPGHYGARTQTINPPGPALRLSSAPMEGKTTTKIDYTKKDIRPRSPMKPAYEYPSNRPPLDDMTTCSRDFKWKDGKPAECFKPSAAVMTTGVPFESDTSYQNTFKKWPVTKREAKEKETYQRPTTKFGGTTSFQRDYVKHPLCRAKLAKPDIYAFSSKQPLNDSTEHNDSFKLWNVGLPDRARKPDDYKPPSTKFGGRTNYQSHYTGDYTVPAEAVKPSAATTIRGDMEFNTCYKDTFKGHRPPPCPAKEPMPGFSYVGTAHGHTFYRPEISNKSETVQA